MLFDLIAQRLSRTLRKGSRSMDVFLTLGSSFWLWDATSAFLEPSAGADTASAILSTRFDIHSKSGHDVQKTGGGGRKWLSIWRTSVTREGHTENTRHSYDVWKERHRIGLASRRKEVYPDVPAHGMQGRTRLDVSVEKYTLYLGRREATHSSTLIQARPNTTNHPPPLSTTTTTLQDPVFTVCRKRATLTLSRITDVPPMVGAVAGGQANGEGPVCLDITNGKRIRCPHYDLGADCEKGAGRRHPPHYVRGCNRSPSRWGQPAKKKRWMP